MLAIDDVVKVLQQKMRGQDIQAQTNHKNAEESKLVSSSDETWLQDQPKESVLLFPGAVVASDTKETSTQQKLLVHCDECQMEIKGNIYCCKTCFDYDLCENCHPKVSKTHANGEHEFRVES